MDTNSVNAMMGIYVIITTLAISFLFRKIRDIEVRFHALESPKMQHSNV